MNSLTWISQRLRNVDGEAGEGSKVALLREISPGAIHRVEDGPEVGPLAPVLEPSYAEYLSLCFWCHQIWAHVEVSSQGSVFLRTVEFSKMLLFLRDR